MSSQLEEYLKSIYEDCISTVSELSKNLHSKKSSINSDKKLFNFDMIVKKFFGSSDAPASADAMYIKDNTVTFIEFKGGFNDIVSHKNKDKSLLECPKNKEIECNDYFEILMQKREQEKNNLKLNLILKIIETFIFYKYELLYNYFQKTKIDINYKLKFVIVINDGIEEYENILEEMSSIDNVESENNTNIISILKQMTKRFRNKNNRYYYNSIEVYGTKSFETILDSYTSL